MGLEAESNEPEVGQQDNEGASLSHDSEKEYLYERARGLGEGYVDMIEFYNKGLDMIGLRHPVQVGTEKLSGIIQEAQRQGRIIESQNSTQ